MRDYREYTSKMPVWDTDQHRGRLHECPFCKRCYWSVWGQARKHYEKCGERPKRTKVESCFTDDLFIQTEHIRNDGTFYVVESRTPKGERMIDAYGKEACFSGRGASQKAVEAFNAILRGKG